MNDAFPKYSCATCGQPIRVFGYHRPGLINEDPNHPFTTRKNEEQPPVPFQQAEVTPEENRTVRRADDGVLGYPEDWGRGISANGWHHVVPHIEEHPLSNQDRAARGTFNHPATPPKGVSIEDDLTRQEAKYQVGRGESELVRDSNVSGEAKKIRQRVVFRKFAEIAKDPTNQDLFNLSQQFNKNQEEGNK